MKGIAVIYSFTVKYFKWQNGWKYGKSKSNELFNSKRQEICWKRELKVLFFFWKLCKMTLNQAAIQYWWNLEKWRKLAGRCEKKEV